MRARTPITFNQQGEGWHLDPPRNRVVRLGLGLFGALAVVGAVGNLLAGEVAPGVSLAVLAAVFLGSVALMSRRRTPVAPRHLSTDPGPGLLLPTRDGSALALGGFAALGALCLLGGIGGGVTMLVDGSLLGLVPLLGGSALGLLFLAGARGTWVQRRTPDHGILLTPHAVVLRTRVEPETIPWSELTAVRDHWGRAVRVGPTLPDDVIRNWLTFESGDGDGDRLSLLSGTPHPSVPVETLATEPALALAACRHYLDHPADRTELATPQAVRRWV